MNDLRSNPVRFAAGALLFLLFVLSSAAALAQSGLVSLNRSVVSSGGNAAGAESAGLRMQSTLGQAMVGQSQSEGGRIGLSSGYHPAFRQAGSMPTATETTATPSSTEPPGPSVTPNVTEPPIPSQTPTPSPVTTDTPPSIGPVTIFLPVLKMD